MDADRKLLPLQFVVDPGEGVCWSKDENNDEFVRKVSLTDKQKLELLEKYLDVSYIKLNSKSAEQPKQPEVVKNFRPQLEKSVTLPSNFEFGAIEDKLEKATASSSKSEQSDSASDKEQPKAAIRNRAARQIQNLGRRFGSLRRSFSKKLRKNLSSIARRSSFRSKSSAGSAQSQTRDNNAQGSSKTADVGSAEELSSILSANDTLIVAMLRTEKRHDYHEGKRVRCETLV